MQLATMFKNRGFTRNRQARCPGCLRTVNLADLGFRRDALRLFHLEPVPSHAAD